MSSGHLGLNWRLGLMAVALAGSAVFTQLQVTGWADAQLHDLFTRWLPARPAPAQMVMVDIDERSLAEIGPWPWPRPVIAQLMKSLRERGARLQVWDIFLADPASGDAQVQEQLANPAPDILLAQVLVVDPAVQDPPHAGRLQAMPDAPDICASHPPIIGQFGVASSLQPRFVGHISATPDLDGRLRRLPAVLCQAGQRYPQLTIAAAQALEPQAPWTLRPGNFPLGPDRWLERGKLQFALDEKGYLPVPYHRPHTAWPAISASRLLDPGADLLPLKNQIVVIGATALGLGDTINTPHRAHAPGASVHAELLGAALDHDWVVSPRSPALIAAVIAAGLALLLLPLLQLQRRPALSALALAAALAAPLVIAIFARFADLMLPMTAPSAALLCFSLGLFMAQANTERRQVLRLAAHLQSFLPRGLAREIAQQNPSGESLGKPCEGVLLALRIVGLERWIGSVDSLQALALVHAVSTLADRSATHSGGALEHVQGET
ncbi:MAG: CHASE2 domain-containing protein, partial [Polaromonas sp.]